MHDSLTSPLDYEAVKDECMLESLRVMILLCCCYVVCIKEWSIKGGREFKSTNLL